LRRKEITIINIRRQVRCTQKAIDLIASHGVDLDSMVTHRFPLGETQAAFEIVEAYRDGVMKAIISVE
jgi:L-iditol 2-dehydrogenase